MPEPLIDDLHPEVLDAFFGGAPLTSAQGHFSSRAELLNAYADCVAATLGRPPADGEAQCGVCGCENGDAFLLVVAWRARTRILWTRFLRLVVLLPFRLSWYLHNPGEVLQAAPTDAHLFQYARMKTLHPLCARCHKRIRFRAVLFVIFILLDLLAAFASGALAMLAGIGTLSRLLGWFGARPQDALKMIPIFIGSSAAFWAAVVLFALAKRLLIPRSIRKLVKKPFVVESRNFIR